VVEPALMSYRLTVIMLVVLAAIGGAVYFSEFRDKGSTSDASADRQKLEVLKFESQDSQKLEVSRSDGSASALKSDSGDWTLQPSGRAGDSLRLSSLLTRLSTLTASRRVADAATDLSQYGLGTPYLTAKVTQKDGTIYTLQAGAKAPTETGTYVKRLDDPAVFLISNQLVTDLERFITDPPIQQSTPTPAPIPTVVPTPLPSPSPSPGGTGTPASR
jgi:hypothetical protein